METPKPRVYPRLPVSATDAALTSGALANQSDEDLLRRLRNWRDEVNGFNRRLELTEIRIFTSGLPTEIADFERALHSNDSYLNDTRSHLRELLEFLSMNYLANVAHDGRSDENGSPDMLSNETK
jgi:hypothetical protein